MTETLLSAEQICVEFRVGSEYVRAVDGVSLDVSQGETLGIVGESGSGKSSFARAVMGLTQLADGRLLYNGADPVQLSKRKRRDVQADYQMVFQDSSASLNPRRRIIDSVVEPLVVHKRLTRNERVAKALELLKRVGLSEEHSSRYPHELSGGQRQRVNIARALILDPKLVVCDESVASLDVALQSQVLNLLSALRRDRQVSYVFITHDLAVAGHMSDRIAVMYLGRLMELAPADTLIAHPRHPYTAALLSAQPTPVPGRSRIAKQIVLEGELPSPINPPSGCRFRTRCPFAQQRCADEVPEWRTVGVNHQIACHFAEELDLLRGRGAEVA